MNDTVGGVPMCVNQTNTGAPSDELATVLVFRNGRRAQRDQPLNRRDVKALTLVR